jgi:hypothetical protein
LYKLFPNEPSAIELFNGDTNMEAFLSDHDVEVMNKVRDDSQIQTLAMVLISEIGKRLSDLGIDPHERPYDFCFLSEAIISYVSAHYEREHPLQDIAAATIGLEDDDEELMYKFYPPKVNIMKRDQQDDTD